MFLLISFRILENIISAVCNLLLIYLPTSSFMSCHRNTIIVCEGRRAKFFDIKFSYYLILPESFFIANL